MASLKQVNENFKVGVGTVGDGASKRLTGGAFELVRSVHVKCTTGTIYVGSNAGVSATNGYPLVATGDSVVEIAIDDPYKVWIIGHAAGQVYKWLAS